MVIYGFASTTKTTFMQSTMRSKNWSRRVEQKAWAKLNNTSHDRVIQFEFGMNINLTEDDARHLSFVCLLVAAFCSLSSSDANMHFKFKQISIESRML